MDHEPRSATRLLFIVAALSIAGLLAGFGATLGKYRAPVASVTPTWVSATKTFEEIDTDGDTLPDWQETLLGTDPDNIDSDGDGKTDSFEPRASLALKASAVSAPKSVTDAAAERLVRQYLTLKQANAYTPERGEQIASGLIESIYATVAFEPFNESSLTLVPANKESVLMYQERFRDTMAAFLDLQGSEIALFGEYANTKNEYYLAQLEGRASLYESVAQKILAIPTPNDMAAEHLEVVNGLAYFGAVLRDLARFGRDPLTALSLLRAYNEAEEYVGSTFTALSSRLNTQQL